MNKLIKYIYKHDDTFLISIASVCAIVFSWFVDGANLTNPMAAYIILGINWFLITEVMYIAILMDDENKEEEITIMSVLGMKGLSLLFGLGSCLFVVFLGTGLSMLTRTLLYPANELVAAMPYILLGVIGIAIYLWLNYKLGKSLRMTK